MKNEQEQGRAGQQLVLPAPGGFNEGTPASSMELDLPRVRGAHGGWEEQGIQVPQKIEKDLYPIPRVDVRWKRMLHWETCEWKWEEGVFCKEEKEQRNSQGKKTAKVVTSVPLRGGGFRRSARKRSGRKRGKRKRTR